MQMRYFGTTISVLISEVHVSEVPLYALVLCVFTMLQVVACKKDPPPPWVQIAISTNGRKAALIDKDGYIWTGSSDFRVCCLCCLYVICKLSVVCMHTLHYFTTL